MRASITVGTDSGSVVTATFALFVNGAPIGTWTVTIPNGGEQVAVACETLAAIASGNAANLQVTQSSGSSVNFSIDGSLTIELV